MGQSLQSVTVVTTELVEMKCLQQDSEQPDAVQSPG